MVCTTELPGQPKEWTQFLKHSPDLVVALKALLIGPARIMKVSYWPKDNRPFMGDILVSMEAMWSGREMVVLDLLLLFDFFSQLLEGCGSKTLL